MAQVQIFFGSQTGTAECFAEEVCDEAKQQGIECEVLDLQAFDKDSFAMRKIVVFVVSTYGEGEPSDNAVQFHKWASDPRNDGALKGQRYTVMGLGDMNYSKFNNMGMMTDMNLERLGGKRIYRRGVGDDSQDIAADFKEWKDGGLWAALKQAIAEVMSETGGAGFAAPTLAEGQVEVVPVARKGEVHVFYAHESEADGAAKDICDSIVAGLKEKDAIVSAVHDLANRKSIEFVKKLPKRSVALVIADCNPDGLCSAGRKLIRNMSLELDSKALSEKDLRLVYLAVASSKCNSSASSLREQLIANAVGIPKAFERVGVDRLGKDLPLYVDAGVENVEPVVKELCAGVATFAENVNKAAAPTNGASAPGVGAGAAGAATAPPAPAKKTRVLCAGPEAAEAGEALSGAWPGGCDSVEDASLSALASAAQEQVQVVLAVQIANDGALSDAARGLGAQIGAAPIALRASLRQLRFALLTVAETHYGNAGERASANAARDELTQAVAPIQQALQKIGAGCIASTCIDLQDAGSDRLAEICGAFQKGFSAGMAPVTPQATSAVATPPKSASPAVAVVAATTELKMAPTAAGLPAEVSGEPSDVVARFYFEAEKTKVAKVRELRQKPEPEAGLATVEVELEATGNLKEYKTGGTLSLLPENDPADVEAAVQLMGLTPADLSKWITFVPPAGSAQGTTIKRPFPTPCTLGDALSKYCDLARAPTKKMLTALQPKLSEQAARDCVAKLLADVDALKVLQGAKLCCRMHEFWAMLGVKNIAPLDFLLHCPRQKPREFTIASSPKATPQRITLCVSLTSHELPDMAPMCKALVDAGCLPSAELPTGRGRFYGTCSKWLTTRLKAGAVVLAKQRPSPLHLPEKDVPVIMIGAGAGVAPFRGFWEELRRGSQTAPTALFFGCRHPEQDWLFKEEMSSAVKLAATGCAALQRMQVGPKRPLTSLFTAFSRPGEGKEGQYVQDQIRAQSMSVKHWIEKMSGIVYICGSTAMGNGVLDALAEALEGGRDTVDAMKKDGRIVVEMWG